MDIRNIFNTLLKHAFILIVCPIITVILVIFFTRNMPKEYESEATVYTGIASGYSMESVIQNRPDNTSRYAFDNLLNIVKSRQTLKEVGLRLLSLHLTLEKADPKLITIEHLEYIKQQIPTDIQQLITKNPEETYRRLDSISDSHPYLIAQINYPAAYYSIPALSKVTVTRVMNSDIVKLIYPSEDQGICQKTLEILIDASIRNFRKINESQTDSVVAYFEKQLELARQQLKKSEEKDLWFKKANNLVNYDAQTDIVIAQRENILNQIHAEQEVIYATEAALKNIESQLGSQAQTLKNREILDKREQLSRLSNQLSMAELNNNSPERIANLRLQVDQIKEELNRDMAEMSGAASGGVASDKVVSEYFTKMISYEESKARLKALESRRNETIGQYSQFLPLGDTLKRIQREIDINEKAYLAALQNLNQSKMRQQDQQSLSTIQIIDKPNYPLMSKTSYRKLYIVMGGMMGFLIPAAICLLLAYFNADIKTPQRAEEATGLKIGGIFPNIKELTGYKNSEQISDGLSDTILRNIYISNQQSQQRVLIISTRPSEGKTTISNLLCERLLQKGKKCLVVVPYLDSGSWSVVNYKIDSAFYQSKAEDLVPVERLNETDVLILELPSLILNDYPITLIRQFNVAFLICEANREWTKADQSAIDGFIKISGITPYIILNDVTKDVVEDVLGKIS